MPLFNIVGVTNLHSTFEITCAFLSGKLEADYTWCLECLQSVAGKYQIREPYCVVTDSEIALVNGLQTVPFFVSSRNILCIWHINQKVAEHFKVGLTDKEWEYLCQQLKNLWAMPTKSEFCKHWQTLCESGLLSQDKINYINNQWISKKRYFAHYKIDQYMHFGHYVSSRGEGAHHQLKSFLETSTGTLLAVWKALQSALQFMDTEYKTALAQE